MRRFGRTFIALIIVIPAAAGGWVLRSLAPETNARVFSQVLQLVDEEALKGLTEDQIFELAARGLVDRIDDDYAALYSPQELATFSREQLGADYGGLGMLIEDQQGSITVTRVFPNTPAERGGVRAGDRIIAVNGESTRGLKLEEVSSRLIGRAGTEVEASFARAGISEPLRGKYTRAVVHIPAVPYGIVLDGGVGYIPLQKFNEDASRDVVNTVRSLSQRGAKSFVLDLRGNTGGSLDEALMISNLFLRAGQEILRVEYRNRQPDIYTARNATLIPEAPMAILTDGYSASASEIVAGALQDHDRAIVVGTTSFGKGLVQQIYNLDGGWAMKLTTGRWLTPVGRSLQRERNDDGSPVVADTAKRPEFKSTGGRVVFGGGGVTPDLMVKPDTMDAAEQEFARVLGAKGQLFYIAVYDQALAIKNSVASDFTVQPEWRDQLFARLQAAEVPVTRQQFDAARPLIDRNLEQRIAGLAFGDSASFRRFVPFDSQLRAATDLLKQATSQREVYAAIDRRNSTARRSDD